MNYRDPSARHLRTCWYLESWYIKPFQTAEYYPTWFPWCDPPKHIMSGLIFFLCSTLFIIDQKTIGLHILCNQLSLRPIFRPALPFIFMICDLPSRPSYSLFLQNNVLSHVKAMPSHNRQVKQPKYIFRPTLPFLFIQTEFWISLLLSKAQVKEQYFEQTVTVEQ